jgi:hypothetical protein
VKQAIYHPSFKSLNMKVKKINLENVKPLTRHEMQNIKGGLLPCNCSNIGGSCGGGKTCQLGGCQDQGFFPVPGLCVA